MPSNIYTSKEFSQLIKVLVQVIIFFVLGCLFTEIGNYFFNFSVYIIVSWFGSNIFTTCSEIIIFFNFFTTPVSTVDFQVPSFLRSMPLLLTKFSINLRKNPTNPRNWRNWCWFFGMAKCFTASTLCLTGNIWLNDNS